MTKLRALFIAGLALAPFVARAAYSADDPAPAFVASRDLSSVQFTEENNSLGIDQRDKYYANGFKLAYVTPALSDDNIWNYRAHFGLAQEIYTASDSGAIVPPAGDHPYSAWLYAMAGLGWEDDSTLDLLTLRAGVVGPSALGKQAQQLAGSAGAGWGTQLHDEPGVDLSWSRVWRARLTGPGRGFAADILPRVGLEGGSVRTYAESGVQLRFGENLPADFGVNSARDIAVDGAPVKFKGADGFSFSPDSYYGFVDFQAEAWAQNMAITGNMYQASAGAALQNFVGQAGFGVAVQWAGTKLVFAEDVRTREFKGADALFSFGSVALNVAF